jgi:hypothetical protein
MAGYEEYQMLLLLFGRCRKKEGGCSDVRRQEYIGIEGVKRKPLMLAAMSYVWFLLFFARQLDRSVTGSLHLILHMYM